MFKKIQKYYSDNEICLIPYEKIELTSSRNTNEIKSGIGLKLEWTETFGMAFHKKSFKKYEGWIINNEFKFRRILKSGNNSFIPIVSGKIIQENQSSKIEVDIRFHKFAYILLVCFIVFSVLLIGLDLFPSQNNDILINSDIQIENIRKILNEDKYSEYFSKEEASRNIGSGLFFIILPYIVSLIFFNIESKLVKDDLRELLKTKNENITD